MELPVSLEQIQSSTCQTGMLLQDRVGAAAYPSFGQGAQRGKEGAGGPARGRSWPAWTGLGPSHVEARADPLAPRWRPRPAGGEEA